MKRLFNLILAINFFLPFALKAADYQNFPKDYGETIFLRYGKDDFLRIGYDTSNNGWEDLRMFYQIYNLSPNAFHYELIGIFKDLNNNHKFEDDELIWWIGKDQEEQRQTQDKDINKIKI